MTDDAFNGPETAHTAAAAADTVSSRVLGFATLCIADAFELSLDALYTDGQDPTEVRYLLDEAYEQRLDEIRGAAGATAPEHDEPLSSLRTLGRYLAVGVCETQGYLSLLPADQRLMAAFDQLEELDENIADALS